MKLFLLLLLIVLIWSNSNALQCVNHKTTVIFTALNVTKAIEFVDTLPTTEEYKVCYIVYQVLYPKNDFAVSFGVDISEVPGDVNMDVYFEMELYMAMGVDLINPAQGIKVFYFKCNDEDACERNFWRNHIDAFVKEDLTIFKEAIRSALITEIQEKVQCTVQNAEKQETCQGDACFATFANNLVAGCAGQDQRSTSINFGVLSKFAVNASFEYGLAMRASLYGPNYICQFDQCNNRETYNKVRAAFTVETLHLSSIREALSITLQEKQTTKPEGESSSTSTGSPKPEGGSSSAATGSPKPEGGSSSTSTGSPKPEGGSSSAATGSPKPEGGSSSTSTESPKPEGGSSSTSTGSPKPGISSSSTSTSPNNSILHYIFMNILILHSLFLIFF